MSRGASLGGDILVALGISISVIRARSRSEVWRRNIVNKISLHVVIGRVHTAIFISVLQQAREVGVIARLWPTPCWPRLRFSDHSILIVIDNIVVHCTGVETGCIQGLCQGWGRRRQRRRRRRGTTNWQPVEERMMFLREFAIIIHITLASDRARVVVVLVVRVDGFVNVAKLTVGSERTMAQVAVPVAAGAGMQIVEIVRWSPDIVRHVVCCCIPALSAMAVVVEGGVVHGGVGGQVGPNVRMMQILSFQETGKSTSATESVFFVIRRLGVHSCNYQRVRGVPRRITAGRVGGCGVVSVCQAVVTVVVEGVKRGFVVSPQCRLLAVVPLKFPARRDPAIAENRHKGDKSVKVFGKHLNAQMIKN